ncbi:hypothetical protein INR49_018779 [Caranx melampygus]|nr:hypothetical protein INR49_018779 [Caranx melampygus]
MGAGQGRCKDPNFSSSRDHFIRGPLTQSLDFAKRKVRSMKGKKKGAITEDALEEGEEEKEQEEEEVKTEVEETYTLPEIPHTLLSVMQISQMIEEEDLEAAHITFSQCDWTSSGNRSAVGGRTCGPGQQGERPPPPLQSPEEEDQHHSS